MTNPAAGALLLERGTVAGGAPTDVLIAAGRIAAVGAGAARDPRAAGAARLDLSGYLLLPSAVEPHAHLDKALLARRAANPRGDLAGAIAAVRAAYETMDEADLTARAAEALTTAVAHGYTAVRSHADCTAGIGTRGVRALVGERAAGLADLQVVALPGFPFTGPAGTENRRALAAAVAAGAGLVGGAPALDDDPPAAVRELVAAAHDAGLPLDLHVDESTDAGVLTLRRLASEVARRGLGGRVTASHCVSLGRQSPGTARGGGPRGGRRGHRRGDPPADQPLPAGPGRADPGAVRPDRGGRAARRGGAVAAGGDNWRDPFNPLGRIDPFETAALAVAAAHLPVAEAYEAVSSRAREVLGLPPVAVSPGSPADLLAIRAADLNEAVAAATEDRMVIRSGQVVARTHVLQETSPTLR